MKYHVKLHRLTVQSQYEAVYFPYLSIHFRGLIRRLCFCGTPIPIVLLVSTDRIDLML